MRITASSFVVATLLASSTARAQQGPSADEGAAPPDVSAHQTNSAAVSPTLLFIPAAALPALHVRLVAGADVQSPSGAYATVQPVVTGEVGLGRGFTVAAGTRWLGGDTAAATAADGLTPFAQVRYQLFGRAEGVGLLGGAALSYKQVGFLARSPELEAAFSLHYRARRFDVGGQAVLGQELGDIGGHDAELHAFATYRVLPVLALGVAGQARADLGSDAAGPRPIGKNDLDALGGVIANLTVDRWQLGGLVGGSTFGLSNPAGAQVGLVAELFGSVIF